MFPCRKKFPKFDKIIRNIFQGIFLRRKFPHGNFPEFVEVKHLFTAVKLYFLETYYSYKSCCDKVGHGTEKFPKSFQDVSGNIR